MTQNTSSAVMQQRHEAHDSLDDFPTPPWAARALCEYVVKPIWESGTFIEAAHVKNQTVWEPAANRGYMARGLSDYFKSVHASDIHDYGAGFEVEDFLLHGSQKGKEYDWIITNPPFRLAAQFAHRAAFLSPRKGYALLVRTSFLEGQDRYQTLFSINPPTHVAQFVERVPMVKGRHDPDASTATSYAWLVWSKAGFQNCRTEFVWIPPCRRQLQKPGDANER